MNLATLLLALALPTWADRASEPVMLDFTAEWCGPCRAMRPAVEQLVRAGYPIKPVDIDQDPELAERYRVTGVPTFVIIDPQSGEELARNVGGLPAAQLANLYNQARSKFAAENNAEDGREEEDVPRARDSADAEDEGTEASAAPVNPKPWQTVVRIKVHGQGAIGFGSGTLIYSSPKESLILTCAHIFKLDGRQQAPPSKFPRRITVDLFDGRLTGRQPAQVHYANETYEGEAIDYDFTRDVGLIRIRPGRRLPYARVVPAHWKPQARMRMITVGCSEGHDATAWNTIILNPEMRGLQGNGAYEAIECKTAPKQGRSGGGLFTEDGYVAGVCDFAEPRGDRGLYATPTSIYSILDRNNLMALYAPVDSGRLLADNRAPRRQAPAARRNAPEEEVARGQSPDREESAGGLTIPPPEILGIPAPRVVARTSTSSRESEADRRSAWQPKGGVPADLKLDASLDPDRFARPAAEPEVQEAPRPQPRKSGSPTTRMQSPAAEAEEPAAPPRNRVPVRGGWKPGKTPLPAASIPVRTAQ